MPVGDIYQAKLVTYDTSQLGLIIRHYLVTASTAPEPTLTVMANSIYSAFAPTIPTMISNNASFRGVTMKRISPLPASLETPSTLAPGPGSGGPVALPKQVAGLIKLITALGGRANRGRVYVPFPPANFSSGDGAPTAAYVTALQNLGAVLVQLQSVTSGGGNVVLSPVIYHRRTSQTTLITGFVARGAFASQRRRGDFGRPNPIPF